MRPVQIHAMFPNKLEPHEMRYILELPQIQLSIDMKTFYRIKSSCKYFRNNFADGRHEWNTIVREGKEEVIRNRAMTLVIHVNGITRVVDILEEPQFFKWATYIAENLHSWFLFYNDRIERIRPDLLLEYLPLIQGQYTTVLWTVLDCLRYLNWNPVKTAKILGRLSFNELKMLAETALRQPNSRNIMNALFRGTRVLHRAGFYGVLRAKTIRDHLRFTWQKFAGKLNTQKGYIYSPYFVNFRNMIYKSLCKISIGINSNILKESIKKMCINWVHNLDFRWLQVKIGKKQQRKTRYKKCDVMTSFYPSFQN